MAGEEQKHILVIEESQALGEAIQELLAREGFGVTVTAGGAPARALLESRAAEFDLIVVSLHLSPSPDFDVLEWLRAERSRLPIPILALTEPTKMALTVERLRGLEAVGVQDTRTLWDVFAYRVRSLVYPQGHEQRAAIRTPSGLPVNCHAGQAWRQGIIGNISRNGMFVRLEGPPGAEQQVLLQFILPDIPRLFEVKARVAWVSRRDKGMAVPGMGVEFLDLDEAGSSQINAFVRLELEKFGRIPGA
jgi:CheY-like chemotaxis protein/Tfp pilus assembly protein PilZ